MKMEFSKLQTIHPYTRNMLVSNPIYVYFADNIKWNKLKHFRSFSFQVGKINYFKRIPSLPPPLSLSLSETKIWIRSDVHNLNEL